MVKQPIFDGIVFVNHGAFDTFPGKLNPIAAAIRGESEMGGGGNIFKSILSIAVSVAVPFLAPHVASAIFGTSSIIASAFTGAAMGAIGAKLTGGDWRQGALFGGIGGGANAFFQGAGFTQGIPQAAQSAVTGPGVNSAVITNTGSGTGYFNPQLGQFVDPMTGGVIAPQNIAYGGNVTSDIATTLSSGGMDAQQLANSMTGISVNTSVEGARALGTTNLYDPAAGTGKFFDAGAQVNAYAGAGQAVPYDITLTSSNAAKEAATLDGKVPGATPPVTNTQQPLSYWETLKSRVADPSKMVDMTLTAAPRLIGAIYASQADKEQQEQIDRYQRELKSLQDKDEAAYQLKLKEAQEYIQNAKNINPSYWAQQAANQAQISGARGLAETYRDDRMAGLRSPSYMASEKRRANIAIGQNVGTAYDRGYGVGLNLRDSSIQQGLNMIPNAPRTGVEGIGQLSRMYANLDASRASAGQGAAQLASYFTYPMLSQQTRDTYYS